MYVDIYKFSFITVLLMISFYYIVKAERRMKVCN